MASPAKPSAPPASVPQLPEKVMMALVSTPAMFAVPTSINKGFNPPFVLRVGVVSTAPTQIKATVAAYVLQKDQARPLTNMPRLLAPTVRISLQTPPSAVSANCRSYICAFA